MSREWFLPIRKINKIVSIWRRGHTARNTQYEKPRVFLETLFFKLGVSLSQNLLDESIFNSEHM